VVASISGTDTRKESKMKIPKGNAKLCDIIEFYLVSSTFARLSGASQKDYELHLRAVMNTPVEGKTLGNYRCTNIKVRHLTQAYEHWLKTGIRTANYRKSVLSAAWKYAMRHDVMTHNPISLVQARSGHQGGYSGASNRLSHSLRQDTVTSAGAA